MGDIFKKKAVSQFAGGLNLSGISEAGHSAERALDENAKRLELTARDTYKKESSALARKSMAESFLKNKESPDALMADFNLTRNKIAETIQDDEAKLSFLTDFEIASAPYVRSSKKAFEVKTSNQFKNATRNSVDHDIKTLTDNASVTIAASAKENPEAHADFSIIKDNVLAKMDSLDPITGKNIYSDAEKTKIKDFIDNGVHTQGVLDTQSNILENQGTEEAISYSKNVLETSAEDMGITTDAKKDLDEEIEVFLENPKVNAIQLNYKLGIAADSKEITDALYNGEIDKSEASNALIQVNKQIDIGFSNGMLNKDDSKMLKAQKLITKNVGKNVLSDSIFKGSNSAVGASFQSYATDTSKQNSSLAGGLYIDLVNLAEEKGVSLNDTSKSGQEKAKKIIQEVNRDYVDTVTDVVVYGDKPNAVLQLNGDLNEYDPDNSTGSYLTIGIFGGE